LERVKISTVAKGAVTPTKNANQIYPVTSTPALSMAQNQQIAEQLREEQAMAEMEKAGRTF
jgi:hypothetical protein